MDEDQVREKQCGWGASKKITLWIKNKQEKNSLDEEKVREDYWGWETTKIRTLWMGNN